MKELPKTLDETYERTLQEIDEEMWEIVHRIFQCLTASFRPLHVEELAELFAIEVDPETNRITEFNAHWRPQNAEAAVLSACRSLIAVVNEYEDKVVHFSHFTVKEFLTSSRLERSRHLSQYYILPRPAHTFFAEACLCILLQLDSRIHKNSLKRMFPLATYAAEHWVSHAQRGDISSFIKDGMESLFDGDRP